MEMADTGSAKMESSDNETQVEQPSPSIKVESDKHELKPVARDERLLTGHPREEK
jgi:hypothetical protein